MLMGMPTLARPKMTRALRRVSHARRVSGGTHLRQVQVQVSRNRVDGRGSRVQRVPSGAFDPAAGRREIGRTEMRRVQGHSSSMSSEVCASPSGSVFVY